jgi:hypothetical protein
MKLYLDLRQLQYFIYNKISVDLRQFNEDDPLQQNLCGAGEACLWYSWQKSAGETSFIRQRRLHHSVSHLHKFCNSLPLNTEY